MTTRFSSSDLQSITKEQVLRFSVADRLEYFHGIRLSHPRVSEAMADLKLMAKPGAGSDITLLIGPTGVGKSTVVNILRDQTLEENSEKMRADPGMIPIAVAEAPASGERNFSWRIFYQRLGESLQEPLMMKKQQTVEEDGRVTVRPVSTSATVAALRTSVEKALVRRKTSIVVVDEAVHLLRNLHGNSIENHMDAIKSLANICGVNMILVGSYDLLSLMNLSGQVARRTSIVHFPRYFTGEKLDEGAFAKVLTKLAGYLPIEKEVDLTKYAGDLQQACVGCVGILKDTLSRALALALRDGGKWKDAYLEKAILSPAQLAAILQETVEGEKQMVTRALGSGSFKASAEQYRDIELLVAGDH
ncbi:MAG TPA: AAA family ATPase [Holophagaceae bacterium]|nr:AAA family ATPase [Holophagaceae bacterium]